MQRMYKKYIEVEMLVGKMGDITPLALIWDGERYEVNKIIRHKPQADRHQGDADCKRRSGGRRSGKY